MTEQNDSENVSKKVSKKEIVNEIATDLNIRVEVVEVILDRFIDVAIEKIVNNEDFSLMNIFSVGAHNEGNIIIPESPNGSGNSSKKVTGRKKLHSRLSRNVRALYRLQNDKFPDKPYIINRDNWRDALKWSKQETNKVVIPKVKKQPVEDHNSSIIPETAQSDDLFYDDDLD